MKLILSTLLLFYFDNETDITISQNGFINYNETFTVYDIYNNNYIW